jgi:hypothetical protein
MEEESEERSLPKGRGGIFNRQRARSRSAKRGCQHGAHFRCDSHFCTLRSRRSQEENGI